MDFFEDLKTTILILNAVTGGALLPVVAGVLILIMVAALWAMSDRLRGLPKTPSKVERILIEDAAQRPMSFDDLGTEFHLDDEEGPAR